MKRLNIKLPLDEWFVTQTYGNVFNGKKHLGIDLRASYKPLRAPISGRADIMYEPLGGKWLILNCEEVTFKFAHLSKYKKLGQVNQGDVIAITGNSGSNTTAPHLHLELYINNVRVNPEEYMIYKIKAVGIINNQVLVNVTSFFRGFGYNVLFDVISQPFTDFWGTIDFNSTTSWADTEDTHNTPGYYNMGYSAQSLTQGPNRTPEDIIIHEILHCLYEDAELMDIHDYNFGVADNIEVINFLINNKKPMRYVIVKDTKQQYLLDDVLKIALSIADEVELLALFERGLNKEPEKINSINGYEPYPLLRSSRMKDLFNY